MPTRASRSRLGAGSTTGSGGLRRALSFFAAGLLLLSGGAIPACAPAPARFAGAAGSERALVEEVLRALEAKDRVRLASLALSEREFKSEAYPEMPAYGKIPADFAWQQLAARSEAGLSTILARQGGRAYQLSDVERSGRQAAYKTFVVHRRPMVRVRDRESGEEKTLALFGSILEHRGRFKLFSFNLDR